MRNVAALVLLFVAACGGDPANDPAVKPVDTGEHADTIYLKYGPIAGEPTQPTATAVPLPPAPTTPVTPVCDPRIMRCW